jgi:hypothetical protein
LIRHSSDAISQTSAFRIVIAPQPNVDQAILPPVQITRSEVLAVSGLIHRGPWAISHGPGPGGSIRLMKLL